MDRQIARSSKAWPMRLSAGRDLRLGWIAFHWAVGAPAFATKNGGRGPPSTRPNVPRRSEDSLRMRVLKRLAGGAAHGGGALGAGFSDVDVQVNPPEVDVAVLCGRHSMTWLTVFFGATLGGRTDPRFSRASSPWGDRAHSATRRTGHRTRTKRQCSGKKNGMHQAKLGTNRRVRCKTLGAPRARTALFKKP